MYELLNLTLNQKNFFFFLHIFTNNDELAHKVMLYFRISFWRYRERLILEVESTEVELNGLEDGDKSSASCRREESTVRKDFAQRNWRRKHPNIPTKLVPLRKKE